VLGRTLRDTGDLSRADSRGIDLESRSTYINTRNTSEAKHLDSCTSSALILESNLVLEAGGVAEVVAAATIIG
jgi:hypothetical protein